MADSSLPVVAGVEHSWVDVDGVSLHVAEAGTEHRSERPSIVLLHGWPQHWFCWRHVIPALAATHHVVAVDVRGAGWSDVPSRPADYDKRVIADEIARLIEVMGLDRPVLVGHDWGGWTTLLVAGRHPERIRGAVGVAIVAPWTPVRWYEIWRFAYQPVVGGPWGPFVHRSGQGFLKLLFALGAARGFRWSRSDREEYLARFRDPARARAGSFLYRTFMTRELPETHRGTYAERPADLPVLLLPGQSDGVLAPRIVRRAAGPANVTVTEIAGAGHWVPEEQPAALVDLVRPFIDRVSAPEPAE